VLTIIRLLLLMVLKVDDTDGDGNSEKALNWELKLRDLIRGRSWGSLKLYSASFGETGVEASAAFDSDILLLPVGYILLVMCVCCVPAACLTPVRSRAILSFARVRGRTL
jgi:hypothetical protein